ncbi:hypothetical protein HDU76_003168 [Blyttiomyces sp. JEL0837]|nr:hypothetical protein HDU76_003168 [Blyttiomyces sp. JEL0837]
MLDTREPAAMPHMSPNGLADSINKELHFLEKINIERSKPMLPPIRHHPESEPSSPLSPHGHGHSNTSPTSPTLQHSSISPQAHTFTSKHHDQGTGAQGGTTGGGGVGGIFHFGHHNEPKAGGVNETSSHQLPQQSIQHQQQQLTIQHQAPYAIEAPSPIVPRTGERNPFLGSSEDDLLEDSHNKSIVASPTMAAGGRLNSRSGQPVTSPTAYPAMSVAAATGVSSSNAMSSSGIGMGIGGPAGRGMTSGGMVGGGGGGGGNSNNADMRPQEMELARLISMKVQKSQQQNTKRLTPATLDEHHHSDTSRSNKRQSMDPESNTSPTTTTTTSPTTTTILPPSDPTSIPIPEGWAEAKTKDGRSYFIDHIARITTWTDPRTLAIGARYRVKDHQGNIQELIWQGDRAHYPQQSHNNQSKSNQQQQQQGQGQQQGGGHFKFALFGGKQDHPQQQQQQQQQQEHGGGHVGQGHGQGGGGGGGGNSGDDSVQKFREDFFEDPRKKAEERIRRKLREIKG